jgi:hypothetical protein
VKRAAFAMLLAACTSSPEPVDAGLDAPRDAWTGDPECQRRCAECGIGPCGNPGDLTLGWCGSDRGPCIAASVTCDDLRRCIMGPTPDAGTDG